MNDLHPLFRWMNPYPDLVTVQQLTDYARGLGFAALLITKPILPGQSMVAAALDWAQRIDDTNLAKGLVMAGCWSDSQERNVSLLYVRPLTDTARALWLLSDHRVLVKAMARLVTPSTPLCSPHVLTYTIRQSVYHTQGCRPQAVQKAPWADLEPCLAALLHAFQVTAIDPLEAR